MSFSPEWLALREGADHAARAPAIADAVFAHFAGRDRMTIVDLGCGTGSNLRAMAMHLPAKQVWRLVDWDAQLLDAARAALIAWSDESHESGGDTILKKGDREITLRLEQADLAQALNDVIDKPADLVTATAFFDLVSAQWIDDFVRQLAQAHVPLYAILTYDGKESWEPPHAADAKVLAAFQAHQGGDKGFGPAAGPFAAAHLARALEEKKYRVSRADSPWKLGAADARLIGELAKGAAHAVAETGFVPEDELQSWRAARMSAQACAIGHVDLFARPA